MPTDHELRRRDAWAFLSLDRVLPFYRELWLWIDDPAVFQTKLREEMMPWTASADIFCDDAGEINYVLSDWLVRELGFERFSYLVAWIDHLLARGGASRHTEHTWSWIISDIQTTSAAETGLSHEIHLAIDRLCETYGDRYQQLETRVDEVCGAPLSEWDSAIRRLDFDETVNEWTSHIEDVRHTIILTAEYNLFLGAWDQHCANLTLSHLRQLFSVGQRIAARLKMGEGGDGQHIDFPGSWQLKTKWFLGRLRSGSPQH